MYDAYAGVATDQNLPPYLPGLPKPEAGASAKAAVAAAAHATLSNLFPSQGSFFDSILAGVGDTSNPGHKFGLTVAQKILEDRNNDPIANAGNYKPSLARGKHRVDPDNPNQGFDAPFYGARSKGFAITDRHELEKPPFDNEEYLQALRQVRGKGIAPELTGTLPDNIEARTVDETLIGIFGLTMECLD
jgi:vanadium chloroperoxidase